MLTEAAFRQSFPVFADANVYLPQRVAFWLALGAKLLPESRWDDLHDYGLSLFLAHHLTLDARAEEAACAGTTGQVTGIETSKSVDSVSVSMDVGSITLANAGHWNQTTYGIQLYQMAQMVGAGGIQL